MKILISESWIDPVYLEYKSSIIPRIGERIIYNDNKRTTNPIHDIRYDYENNVIRVFARKY